MPLSRTVLERQLNQAEAEVAVWVGQLSESGVARTDFRDNPKWRTLNAKCNQLRRRLDSVGRTEATDAEVIRRKAEREAAEAAGDEPQEKKPGKGAKAKEAKAGKAAKASAEPKKESKGESQKPKAAKK